MFLKLKFEKLSHGFIELYEGQEPCKLLCLKTPITPGMQFHAEKLSNFARNSHPDLIGDQNDVQSLLEYCVYLVYVATICVRNASTQYIYIYIYIYICSTIYIYIYIYICIYIYIYNTVIHAGRCMAVDREFVYIYISSVCMYNLRVLW